jgi:serine/threonine-protein kinase RsbW
MADDDGLTEEPVLGTSPSVEQQLSREFVFAGSLASLAPVREAIMDFVRSHCHDEQQEIDILMALQEGLANAIVHGCQGDATKLVHCTVEISPSAIEFIIRDPGEGFDSTSVTESVEDGTNLTEHGRGIHLMRELMDEVSYRCNGTELHLKKGRG